MEEIGSRVQNATTKVFTDLDKEILRNMQGDMYRCSAKCCDNKTAGIDDVQRCIENCSTPLTRAQNYLQQEVENFQNRLNRCALDCQDKAKDQMGGAPTEANMMELRPQIESCMSKCADDHIKKLPDFAKKLKTTINGMK